MDSVMDFVNISSIYHATKKRDNHLIIKRLKIKKRKREGCEG